MTPLLTILTYIFTQISTCTVLQFKESIQGWHANYLKAADDKVQVLQHANQWMEVDSLTFMALKMELQQRKRSRCFGAAYYGHITKITNNNQNKDHIPPYQLPAWMITPPHSITEV
jgi:hypothetical protein